MACVRPKSIPAVAFFAAISFAIAPVIGAPVEPSSRPSGSVLAEFQIEHWGEPITIPVVWGGKPACFVLDTNASVTVLNATDFPGLEPFGRNANVGTSGGQRAMQMFRPPDLHVGPFSLADAGHVFRLDLSDLRAMIGRPVIGFLGVSALKNSVVQVDFDERKVRFLRSDNQPHPEWGNSLPMQLNAEHNPAVRLRIGGVEAQPGDRHRQQWLDRPAHRGIQPTSGPCHTARSVHFIVDRKWHGEAASGANAGDRSGRVPLPRPDL